MTKTYSDKLMKNKRFKKDFLKEYDLICKNEKKHLYDTKPAKKLWNKADDAIRSGALLRELYDNVPDELKDISVATLEFHVYDCPKHLRKKLKKWFKK